MTQFAPPRGQPAPPGPRTSGPTASGPPAPHPHHILLLIDQPRNRELLQTELETRYHVTVPEGDGSAEPADLVVVDGRSFKRQRETLSALKAREEAYAPVLLIVPREKEAPLNEHVFDVADEVIHAPISKDELRARIQALLRARRYALKAQQKVEELEATNRKLRNSEQALRRSERFLEGTMDALSAHVVVLDAEGTIVRTNTAWEDFAALNGAASNAVSHGANYLAVCEHTSGPAAPEAHHVGTAIREVIDGARSYFMHEYPCHGPDEERWFMLRVTRFVHEGAPYAVVHHQDITRLKLTELDLLTAKERAEEMSRLKSAFLANMSHEIRTPLTPIIGFSEVLQDEIQSADLLESVDLIHASALRLKQTLTSVLDLSQLESKTVELRPTRVDLAADVAETCQLFAQAAEESGIQLRVDVPPKPLHVEIDTGAFQRVVSNLVNNAIKFTTAGFVAVTLTPTPDQVVLTVQDTGIGIGEAMQEKIFEAFQQESEGFSREYEGSGLGLAITQQLVSLMGGRVHLESTKGEGSTFTVTLPREAPSQE